MAVYEGRYGQVNIVTGASSAPVKHDIAELGTWAVSGINRNMIDYTAFGDTVAKFKPGMIDAGTITFSGFFDGTDSTGQEVLIAALTSGTAISTTKNQTKPRRLRLWASDSTATGQTRGFWTCTGSPLGEVFVTSMETNQDKNGLATVSFTLKISKGLLVWSTAT